MGKITKPNSQTKATTKQIYFVLDEIIFDEYNYICSQIDIVQHLFYTSSLANTEF
ncbi:hypothetical protein [Rodentibacter haemolyticus]|uniref:Uncharacterized protein n=1 Tax=Rodentibacter haemolyticus TaxID=2778911 RepID=A0ABX6UX25_9PAST|nr:hypothetical protein [Rodentibacter haemolyticus]QPB42657.1 hypothetical protein IHV77_00580 [Rodentibacter haemolyticus]